MSHSSRKIIFAACARDCESHLPAVLRNIDNLARRFAAASYVFVENDSTDGTQAALGQFCSSQPRSQLLVLDGLSQAIPQRTLRLAMARNALMAFIRHWDVTQDHDILMLLDPDDVNTRAWDIDVLMRAMDWMHAQPDVVGIFPNQLDHYYDMWALREASRCPMDPWEEVFDHVMAHQCSDEQAFAQTMAKRCFSLPVEAPPMEVESAFGGFGLYRLDAVRRNTAPYCGEDVKVWGVGKQVQVARWQRCEHVNFHMGLRRQGGRLFVMPDMVNADMSGHGFPPDAFRSMLF